MRNLFSFMGVSADGYHADAHGGLAWQTFDQAFTDYSIEQLDEVDTLIFGRGYLRSHGGLLANASR